VGRQWACPRWDATAPFAIQAIRTTGGRGRRSCWSIDGKVVLIDTTPDFYAQAVRENITRVDAVFYTHTHADHILGIDDLRPLSYRHKPSKLPLYARPEAAAFLRRMFSYIFDGDYKFGGLPQLELRPIDGPVDVLGVRFEPVVLIHGETQIYGYRLARRRI
jgi:phosphoribosyl 1,2-cyclic phosphate phosphodiesterase